MWMDGCGMGGPNERIECAKNRARGTDRTLVVDSVTHTATTAGLATRIFAHVDASAGRPTQTVQQSAQTHGTGERERAFVCDGEIKTANT